jgi:hypothetical protein
MRAFVVFLVALSVAGAEDVAAAAPRRGTGGLKPKLKQLVDRLGQIKAPAPVMHEKLQHAKLNKPT